jgi:hypothetical protein
MSQEVIKPVLATTPLTLYDVPLHVDHKEISLYISQATEFVQCTLKFKDTITTPHLAQIRKLGRQVGLKLGV